MAWCLLSSNPLVVPVMTYGQRGSQEQISMIFWSKHSEFNSIKFTSKMSSSYRRPLCWGISMSKGTAWSYLPPDPELNPDGGISFHFNDVIMSAMAFQITSIMIVYSTVYSGRSKKTPKLCVTDLCEGNSRVASEFPAQRTRNEENVSIWHCDKTRFVAVKFDQYQVSRRWGRICYIPTFLESLLSHEPADRLCLCKNIPWIIKSSFIHSLWSNERCSCSSYTLWDVVERLKVQFSWT